MSRRDEEIKKDIIDTFYWDSRIDVSDINVAVDDGAVNLTGTVPDYAMVQAAVSDAWSVSGIQSVNNGLKVQTLIKSSQDLQLQREIENILIRLVHINPDDIQVTVENGWVTFSGEVDSLWKKVRAEESAAVMKGVTGTTNELIVVPTESVEDQILGEVIIKTLERNAYLDINSIHVKVENGSISLSGSVNTRKGRDSAYEAVKTLVGVRHIENNLEIRP